MSLAPKKIEILETLLLNDKPTTAMELAKEMGNEFPPVMMHLLGLVKLGYAGSPKKSLYIITQQGKQTLGIPEINKEKALSILAYAPHDNAFHFYAEVGKPLAFHAHNLRDFANKLEKIDIKSVEFHMQRGDFEAWFSGLGDEELAKKASLLKQRKIAGEELRRKLHEIVEQRYIVLATLAGQPVYTE